MSIVKSLIFAAMAAAVAVPASANKTVEELAKRNMATFTAPKKVSQDLDDKPKNKFIQPVMVKTLINDRIKEAVIEYSGSQGTYIVGDFLPPHYTITEISSNSVKVDCSGKKSPCLPYIVFSTVSE